eukprot:1872107-Rhodomonas_salina.2
MAATAHARACCYRRTEFSHWEKRVVLNEFMVLSATCLRASYAMPGTDAAYGATRWACYRLPGTAAYLPTPRVRKSFKRSVWRGQGCCQVGVLAGYDEGFWLVRRQLHSRRFETPLSHSAPIYALTAPIYGCSAPIHGHSASIYAQSLPVHEPTPKGVVSDADATRCLMWRWDLVWVVKHALHVSMRHKLVHGQACLSRRRHMLWDDPMTHVCGQCAERQVLWDGVLTSGIVCVCADVWNSMRMR